MISEKTWLNGFNSHKGSADLRAYNWGCRIGTYFLTFIFILLYKAIQQNIKCKIIWKNSILNLRRRSKKKKSLWKSAVQISLSIAMQLSERSEHWHCTWVQCDSQTTQGDQHISCGLGVLTFDVLNLCWHFGTRRGIAYQVFTSLLHLACFGP